MRSAAAPTSWGASLCKAITRLIGAVLAEHHDEWAKQRRYLSLDVLVRSRAALNATDPEEATHLAIAGTLSA